MSTATFFLVSTRNSSMLPLTFVFELTEPVPVCSLVRDELQKVCGTGEMKLSILLPGDIW